MLGVEKPLLVRTTARPWARALCCATFVALFVVLAGCEPGTELAVNLVTDFAPRQEFDEVHVTLDGHAMGPAFGTRLGVAFSRPVRVAEISGVAPGAHRLVVTLTLDGVPVVEREIAVRLSGPLIVPAVITRTCEDVVCPGRRDSASATSCFGGQCLDPLCELEAEGDAGIDEACIVAQCEVDADCPARGTCTEPACERGACLWFADDARCESYETCAPADGTCVPGPDAPPMAPTLTFGANGSTTASATWTAVPTADTYELELATDPELTAPTTFEGIDGVTHAVSGLAQGRRHYARVRAIGSSGRAGAWSEVVSAVTSIDAPGAPSLGVEIDCCRAAADSCWLAPPGGSTWNYGRGYIRSHVTCPAGTSPQYTFSGNYTSPTTNIGTIGWGACSEAFSISPSSRWGVWFHAAARCVGPDGVASPASATTSVCGGNC